MYNNEAHQRRQRRLSEVIQCMKEGLNVEQMAEEIGVSRRTVQEYIRYILQNQEK